MEKEMEELRLQAWKAQMDYERKKAAEEAKVIENEQRKKAAEEAKK